MNTVALRHLRTDTARRDDLCARLGRFLNLPMGLVSVLLVLVAFIQLSRKATGHWHGALVTAQWVLWGLFVLEFLIKMALAPHKRAYLKRHWVDLLVVGFPFLGFLRILSVAHAFPVARLVVFGGHAVHPHLAIIKQRGLGKLAIVSVLVILIVATLEYIFEVGAPGGTMTGFGDALWWTAATATTIGNQLYPVTLGGKIVGFVLMLYAIGVFSYVTSSIASALIGGDVQQTPDRVGHADEVGWQPAATRAPDGHGLYLSPREVETLRSIVLQTNKGDDAAARR